MPEELPGVPVPSFIQALVDKLPASSPLRRFFPEQHTEPSPLRSISRPEKTVGSLLFRNSPALAQISDLIFGGTAEEQMTNFFAPGAGLPVAGMAVSKALIPRRGMPGKLGNLAKEVIPRLRQARVTSDGRLLVEVGGEANVNLEQMRSALTGYNVDISKAAAPGFGNRDLQRFWVNFFDSNGRWTTAPKEALERFGGEFQRE